MQHRTSVFRGGSPDLGRARTNLRRLVSRKARLIEPSLAPVLVLSFRVEAPAFMAGVRDLFFLVLRFSAGDQEGLCQSKKGVAFSQCTIELKHSS